jgi:hypothetical protein
MIINRIFLIRHLPGNFAFPNIEILQHLKRSTNETTKYLFQSGVPFTRDILDQLKAEGYKYVQVRSYTLDRRQDYMEPYYFILIPCKADKANKKGLGIYEPINSEILNEWTTESSDMKVLISYK